MSLLPSTEFLKCLQKEEQFIFTDVDRKNEVQLSYKVEIDADQYKVSNYKTSTNVKEQEKRAIINECRQDAQELLNDDDFKSCIGEKLSSSAKEFKVYSAEVRITIRRSVDFEVEDRKGLTRININRFKKTEWTGIDDCL